MLNVKVFEFSNISHDLPEGYPTILHQYDVWHWIKVRRMVNQGQKWLKYLHVKELSFVKDQGKGSC